MNYKQKALDHVRGVCPELKYKKGISHYGSHLEHWLRGIRADGKTMNCGTVAYVNNKMTLWVGGNEEIEYNLTKDGENQDSSFYKAYCEIVGV